jgi:uncharacterized membrane protein
LLVLEIGVPSGSEDELLEAVVDQWPSYLAYLVSFSTIGAVWLLHTVITEHLAHATSAFVRLNLLLLLVVSLLPFPTRLLGEYIGSDESARVAVTIYGLNLLLVSVLVSVLWLCGPGEAHWAWCRRFGRANDQQTAHTRSGRVRRHDRARLIFPVLAVLGYLAIALYIILPVDALRRRAAA